MSKIKEIWCMHHSHLDVGYTHPQPLLMELQQDYIEQAINLCVKTLNYPEESRFRWTCEATYPLMRWIQNASNERVELLKGLIKRGSFCISALPMHTTPGVTAPELIEMLSDLDEIREFLDAKIDTAINHDVNGQPWTIAQVMLDSNIDFYLTGINIHFGGIPFQRPYAFRWETPDKRELLSFVGEHYSLFSQFLQTYEADTNLMHSGIVDYVNRLESKGYDRDFVFLTATNPPLYDNNCPDLMLADLIKKYNEENHEFKIRFVTPEILRDKLLETPLENMPKHRGDWTDYWNFGCGSTARETRVNRLAKNNMQKIEMLESLVENIDKHYDAVKSESLLNSIIFDEHTWGASQSVTDFNSQETYSQYIHKVKTAYQSADLTAYLLNAQIDNLVKNPHQADELNGIVVINTSGVNQKIDLNVPKYYFEKFRHLSALRSKDYIPYIKNEYDYENFGEMELGPFSYKKITFDKLKKIKKANNSISILEDRVITKFYEIQFDKDNGRILQVYSKEQDWNIIDKTSEWGFFELIRETIDGRYNKQKRATLFPRDVDLGNKNVTQWNHEWKACRRGADSVLNWKIEEKDDEIVFVYNLKVEAMENVEQRIKFLANTPRIKCDVNFVKLPVDMPESIYFSLPMSLDENWTSIYDTAGQMIELDNEQLGNVCRDWVTVDKAVSIFDDNKGLMLKCPDAPMVQVGDFNFGKESKSIKRKENPLLLAWTLNNYWDTNFMANQSGGMQFNYEIEPFSKLSKKEIYNKSLIPELSFVIGAVVNCTDDEFKLFDIIGDVTPVYLKPTNKKIAKDDSYIIVLKNHSSEIQDFSFSGKHYSNFKAEIVNIQEKILETLTVTNNVAKSTIVGGGLKLLRITKI